MEGKTIMMSDNYDWKPIITLITIAQSAMLILPPSLLVYTQR